MSVGEKIKIIRKEKGLTQAQLAALVGVAQITIRQYESGAREPSISQLQNIARKLSVSISSFMDTGIKSDPSLDVLTNRFTTVVAKHIQTANELDQDENKKRGYSDSAFVDSVPCCEINNSRVFAMVENHIERLDIDLNLLLKSERSK